MLHNDYESKVNAKLIKFNKQKPVPRQKQAFKNVFDPVFRNQIMFSLL